MRRSLLGLLAALAGSLPAACRAPGSAPEAAELAASAIPGSPNWGAPNWKERLAQPYVYVEHRGDVRRIGLALQRLFTLAAEAGLEPAGPPFALFYDDPAATAVEELVARACLPVAAMDAAPAGLGAAVLPQAMVAYQHVRGPYEAVARSYPELLRWIRGRGWEPGVPVREIYLAAPGATPASDASVGAVTEVQMPWSLAPTPGLTAGGRAPAAPAGSRR